jgi:hypothetical protein
MKGLPGTLLALAFVCFTLISLISVNHDWHSALVQLATDESKVSELGLRFVMRP